MIPSPCLERLIWRESFAEIVGLLTEREMAVVRLKLEGLSDDQVAELLGLSRAAVPARIRRAVERICRERPDLAPLLEGRRVASGPRHCTWPLEQGWVCGDLAGLADEPPVEHWLTVQEAAGYLGVARSLVLRAAQIGCFPRAREVGAMVLIPEGDLGWARSRRRR